MIDYPEKPEDSPASPNATNAKVRGRPFLPGNPGGPGNPLGKRQAAMRNALLNAVTDEDVAAVARGMVNAAKGGDSSAANVLLRYTVGEPDKRVNVDYTGPRLASLRAATLEAIAADCGMTEADDEGR